MQFLDELCKCDKVFSRESSVDVKPRQVDDFEYTRRSMLSDESSLAFLRVDPFLEAVADGHVSSVNVEYKRDEIDRLEPLVHFVAVQRGLKLDEWTEGALRLQPFQVTGRQSAWPQARSVR
jgi:hypothetical protein